LAPIVTNNISINNTNNTTNNHLTVQADQLDHPPAARAIKNLFGQKE
tara:strand:+ start:680 stop:820 length:141 start_codon:yes stop_codon:yes gene_type:complete